MIRPGPLSLLALTLVSSLACQGTAQPPPSPAPLASAPEPTPPAAPASVAGPSEAPAPPAPPALPAELPSDLDVTRLEPLATCSKRTCTLPKTLPREAKPDASGPVAIWRQRLEGREAKLNVPASREGSLFGLVLAGRVSARAGKDAPNTLETWSAFHAPRGGLTLASEGDDATLLLVHVTRPASAPAAPAPRTAPPALEVQHLRDQSDLVWGRGTFRARLAFEGADRAASFGLLRGAPSAPVALHKHEGSWEILIALRAEGNFRLDTNSGQGPARALQDGQSVAVPPDTTHAWEPSGTRPLIGVQLYVPPGPEQRFHKLAEGEAAKSSPPPADPAKLGPREVGPRSSL